ncbi:hypothetical protein ASL14_01680 [Paenibacillus sp. IHB B 3084]|uniref:hypothetical protein n=1 Tax=Paenibacillus sp. IHB B 3084 TaxID=867076 RepID=UPI000721025A|nr:hypothetical protein [Paenibacillus sp. IHB B 3084]ALP35079.1 hypothetical protein ASL14_01680 [Paenibacillus sp. IHB B 3084]
MDDIVTDGKLPSGTEKFDTALFVPAGGYYHHIGGNVWNGEGNPHPPAHATGVKEIILLLPDDGSLWKLKNT